MTQPGDYRDQYEPGSSRYPPPPPPPGSPDQGYRGQRNPERSYPEQEQAYRGPDAEQRRDSRSAGPGSRGRSLLWVALGIVVVILVLNFTFFLAGANDVGFGHIVYGVGNALNAPFRGLFNISLTRRGNPVQWADVIAVVIYTIAAVIIDRLIVIFTTPSSRQRMSQPPYPGPPPRY